MMADDPVTHLDPWRSTRPQLFDHSTRLVAGNHFCRGLAAVTVEVGAAKTRGPYLEDRLARTGVGVRKLPYLSLPVSRKCHSAHVVSPE
jgi:hypothetical protein